MQQVFKTVYMPLLTIKFTTPIMLKRYGTYIRIYYIKTLILQRQPKPIDNWVDHIST